MPGEPPIPAELWDTVPPAARAALLAVFDALQRQLADLRGRVADLEARLAQHSGNSHQPPSADPPHAKPAPARFPSGKKLGGQPGHPQAVRPRLAPDRIIHHKPRRCAGCGQDLTGDDPRPRWRQFWELPAVRPHVTEHRFHTLACPCGHATPAARPAGLPADGYGPRLKAALVYLTGALHLSKTQAQALCADLLGLPVSTGQVCAAEAQAALVLAPAVEALKQALPGCDVNMDETGWKQAGKTCWLWVAVTAAFTVFHLAFGRGRSVVEGLLGAAYALVLTTDRWSAYHRVARRQLCWAHLRRDFQALIDRGGADAAVGERLLALSDERFVWWHALHDGYADREWFDRRLAGVKRRGRAALVGGARGEGKAAVLCGELLRLWPALWRFVEAEGVEPTNNAAERALRPAVLWRKCSQGTRTAAGSGYVATVLSVVATCRQQGRRVWDYLTKAFAAAQHGQTAPSLLPLP
jgi:transposase